MDFDVIGKVLLILIVIPIVIFLWGSVFVVIDDCLCGGKIRYKISQWIRKKIGADDD